MYNKNLGGMIMKISTRFKKLTVGFIMAIALTTSVTGLAAKTQGVKLEGLAKQEYVLKKMDAFFRPTADNKITPQPFVVPQGYTYTKGEINGSKYERLVPKKKQTDNVVLQLHGGGYVLPLRDGHRKLGIIQSELAGNAEVIYVDYRVAPKDRHPAALEDAVNVYSEMLRQGYKAKNIIVIGDSAGGNLAITLSLYLRDHNIAQPGMLVMISPWGTVENTLPSRVYNFNKDLVLGKGASPLTKEITNASYGEGSDFKAPYLSPLYAEDFVNLPPMLIQTGSYEVLMDDGALLAQRAKDAGVKVQYTNYQGMPHDFALMLPDLQDSIDSWEEIRNFIKQIKSKRAA